MREKEPVVMVDYDPRWPEMFEEERARISKATKGRIVILEHIGSTAVVGLGAKPIIDILGGVKRLADAEACIPSLEAMGYVYEKDLEDAFPERRFFDRPSYHLHVVEVGSEFWRRHMAFRDYLRAHLETAAEYYRLKKRLAARHGKDRDGYTDAKTKFVRSVEKKAGYVPAKR